MDEEGTCPDTKPLTCGEADDVARLKERMNHEVALAGSQTRKLHKDPLPGDSKGLPVQSPLVDCSYDGNSAMSDTDGKEMAASDDVLLDEARSAATLSEENSHLDG